MAWSAGTRTPKKLPPRSRLPPLSGPSLPRPLTAVLLDLSAPRPALDAFVQVDADEARAPLGQRLAGLGGALDRGVGGVAPQHGVQVRVGHQLHARGTVVQGQKSAGCQWGRSGRTAARRPGARRAHAARTRDIGAGAEPGGARARRRGSGRAQGMGRVGHSHGARLALSVLTPRAGRGSP